MPFFGAVVMLVTLTVADALAATPMLVDPAKGPARGLYVTRADEAASSDKKTAALLKLIRREQFRQVVLYHLAPLLDDSEGTARLAKLLRKLRAAGVQSIGAPVASEERVEVIVGLRKRDPDARFDFLVTELEYWHNCENKDPLLSDVPPRRDCFPEMQTLVRAMQAAARSEAAAGFPLRTGAYLGYPTASEMRWFMGRLDFVFLDLPIRTPTSPWPATTPRAQMRLRRIAWAGAAGLEVWPIFYSRGEVPMQPWLRTHTLAATEKIFLESVAKDPELARWQSNIGGFQYFTDDGFTP